MSILDPACCGFVKITVYSVLIEKHQLKRNDSEPKKNFLGRVYRYQYNKLKETLGDSLFSTSYETFYQKYPSIIKTIQTMNKKSKIDKEHVLQVFSVKEWEKLTTEKKEKHSLINCRVCTTNINYKAAMVKFPVKSINNVVKAEKIGLNKERELKTLTTGILKQLDYDFENSYGCSFTSQVMNEVATSTPKAPRKSDLKRSVCRDMKQDIEQQWLQTSVKRTLGLPISLRNRQKLRLTQSHEDKMAAIERTEKEKEKIRNGLKKPHDHIGNITNYSWDKDRFLEEIENINVGELNFSDIARRYSLRNKIGAIPGNAGQIMKQLLIENGVEISDSSLTYTKVRCKKRRLNLPSCKEISLPSEPTNDKVFDEFVKDVETGKYTIGKQIVPQEFSKFLVNNHKIVPQKVQMLGRKIPLVYLRKKMLEDHSKYMRARTNEEISLLTKEELLIELKAIGEFKNTELNEEKVYLESKLKSIERSRNLKMWHDGSSLAGHSHILMMVSPLYDNAVYLTNDEYFLKYKKKVNVQSVVEKPYLYILARCPSNDQQILYTEERMEDIEQLSEVQFTSNGIPINDSLRIFIGDKPASQFEMGQQKGGNFFCFACPIHALCVPSFCKSFNVPHLSIDCRLKKILQTTLSIKKSKSHKLKLYDNLKKEEVVSELHQRSVKFSCTKPIKDLQELLKEEMHGIQRVPALLHRNPTVSLEEANLENYEIMFTEPLHDVSNHIKNIYEELPLHLPKEEKSSVVDIISLSFSGKDLKNCSEYRQSLLVVTQWFLEHYEGHFLTNILLTMSEIQEILYLQETYRSIITVLRLHTVLFKHAILLKINFRNNLKTLTSRKFFGSYYHSLFRHSSLQYRIISGRSTNAEKEEATFQSLKNITKLTSNNHNDNIILNAIARFQVTAQGKNPLPVQKSAISNLYKEISPSLENTVIEFTWIKSHYKDFQCLLENIADYLLEGWWTETELGVKFLDKSDHPESKLQIHHFRSSCILKESEHLNLCWKKCLEDKHILIPAYKINVGTFHKPIIVNLTTLQRFVPNDENMEVDHEPVNSPDREESIEDKLKDVFPTTPNKEQDPIETVTSTSINIETSPCNGHVISKPQIPVSKDKEDDIIEFRLITPHNNVQSTKATTLSSTSLLLQSIIGSNDLVNKFDKARKNAKAKKNTENINLYKDCIAEIEVKVLIRYDLHQKELSKLEHKLLKENKSLSLHISNEEEQSQYENMIDQLKKIKALRKELHF